MIPLVLVHGFMGGSAQWDQLTDRVGGNRNVITVDLPGFGQNNRFPAIDRIGHFADWVIAELRSSGVDRYHLLGHSMGGMIVQEIARRDQQNIDHLILYGTGGIGALPGRFETIAQSKARAKEDGLAATARRISATWFLDRENAAGYPGCARIAEQTAPAAFPAGLDAMDHWSGLDFLPQIKPRTRIIWGDGDRTYPWEQTHRLWTQIPQAELAVVPGCAHAVHLEKPDLFASLLGDFLGKAG